MIFPGTFWTPRWTFGRDFFHAPFLKRRTTIVVLFFFWGGSLKTDPFISISSGLPTGSKSQPKGRRRLTPGLEATNRRLVEEVQKQTEDCDGKTSPRWVACFLFWESDRSSPQIDSRCCNQWVAFFVPLFVFWFVPWPLGI